MAIRRINIRRQHSDATNRAHATGPRPNHPGQNFYYAKPHLPPGSPWSRRSYT